MLQYFELTFSLSIVFVLLAFLHGKCWQQKQHAKIMETIYQQLLGCGRKQVPRPAWLLCVGLLPLFGARPAWTWGTSRSYAINRITTGTSCW